MQQLCTFRAPVVDECLHVLLEAFYRVFHLRIEALSSHQPIDKIVKSLENFLVFRQNSIPLATEAFVFGLF